jgi:hypothetical protein
MQALARPCFIALSCVTLLLACGEKPGAVRPGSADARTLGLASTANATNFDYRGQVGFSAFDDMPLEATLGLLEHRYDIHYFSDAQAAVVQSQLNTHYRDIVPSWWPAAPRFLATLFMDDYVVYLADNPSKRGFLMLRIQAGPTSLLPAGPRLRPAPKPDQQQLQRKKVARDAMRDSGIAVASAVFEQAGSSDGGDPSTFRQVYSQYECDASKDGPASLGMLSMIAFGENEHAGVLKAIQDLEVPQSVLPCHVGNGGERRYVVERAIGMRHIMSTPQGALMSLQVAYRLGDNGMIWPGDTLQYAYNWIYWCARSQRCELLSDHVAPDTAASKGIAFAVGMDAQGRASVQQWLVDWHRDRENCHIAVQRTWLLSEKVRLLAPAGERIKLAPLILGYQAATKTYAYVAQDAMHRDEPMVFLGTSSTRCSG